MINRKRLTIIIIGAVALLALLVTGIVLLVAAGNTNANEVPTSSETSEVVEPTIVFTEEQSQLVRNVAHTAVSWNGLTDVGVLESRYKEAGMSEKLSREFVPVWKQALGSDSTAEVFAKMVAEPQIVDYKPDHDGGPGLFIAAVEVTYEGTSHVEGATTQIGPAKATWTFVLDEKYGTVTNIEQPDISELQGL